MSSPMDTNEIHSVENHNHQTSAEQPNNSCKRKKSILYDKTFLVDIVDKVISSKVQKLIRVYGGKLLQSLEKTTDYLISDKIYHERVKHNNVAETNNGRRDNEIKNVPCSKRKNSSDLISKANILSIRVLSAKQFQHWLKSLLKKNRANKNPTDKVASVLKGKVSLKIESMDQGQCPVFEFIPKWPDLGDTLCKNKPKISAQNNFSGCKSGDEYNSSDQYSTSEIGGMCELCDIPFMNYKEHINTKTHIKESQDENKFHELDELINERPLNVIFNQFLPNNEDEKLVLETPSVEYSSNIDFNLANYSDSVCNEQKNVPCSFGDNNHIILEEQSSPCLKRKCCSDTISFVPQKRPCNSSMKKEIDFYKKSKRKHKIRQKISSKDIYKVEVVNNEMTNSNSDRIESHKPSVIIRLKRIQHSNNKKQSSDVDSHVRMPSDNDDKHVLVPRHIRVVRKPSFSDETYISSKRFSNNYTFTFEQPELHRNVFKNVSYYPTNNCIPNTRSNIESIEDKIANLGTFNFKCALSFNKSIKVMSNMAPRVIGEWFYNIPKKIQDDLSFDTPKLIPFTKLSKKLNKNYKKKS